MNKEQEKVWDRLKYSGLSSLVLTFVGNGLATKFNSARLSDCKIGRITVDDVAKTEFDDYVINYNNLIFYKPIPSGHQVNVDVWL